MTESDGRLPAKSSTDIRAHFRPSVPVYAYAGIVLVIAQAVFLFVVRVVAVFFSVQAVYDANFDLVLFLGGALALGIVPAAASVGLGLAAMREAWQHNFRQTVLGAITLGAGAILIVMWVSRMVNATIAIIGFDAYGTFASELFFWA